MKLYLALATLLLSLVSADAGSFFSPAATASTGVRDPQPSGSVIIDDFCVGTQTGVGATTVTCTTSESVPAHSTIAVMVGDGNVAGAISVTGVADGTNTYVKQVQRLATLVDVAIFYVLDPAALASGSTITATFSAAGGTPKYIEAYYMNGTAVDLASTSASGSSSTPSCGALEGAPNRIAFGTVNMLATGDTISQPSGWFAGRVGNNGSTYESSDGYQVNAAFGGMTYNPTGWSNNAWACVIGSFQTSGYVGPGDLVPTSFGWYGLRCFNAAKVSASQAIRIRRASDNTETDIGLTAACALDVATAGTFCTATTCFATKVYDQSGTANDLVQATTTKQPQLIFSCIGSLPCLRSAGAATMTGTRSGSDVAQPFTVVNVAERTGAFTSYGIIWDTGSGVHSSYGAFKDTANKVEIGEDGTSDNVTGSDSAWHVLQFLFNSNSSVIQVDATPTTSANTFLRSAYTPVFLMSNYLGTQNMTGDWTETGYWAQAISAANRTKLCHNAYTYWGTSTSC